jgi:hypothetical protein
MLKTTIFFNKPLSQLSQLSQLHGFMLALFINILLMGGFWLFWPPIDLISWEYFITNEIILIIILLLIMAQFTKSTHIIISGFVAACLGILVFINIFGLKIVDPTQINWLMRGDWEWQFLGWHVFRHEDLHFPWGKIEHFWYPVGTSVGYIDAIPIMVFVFKPLSAFLPADFQYFGLWFLLCYILQGIFAALLVQQVTTNLMLKSMAILFFLMTTVLIHRTAHPALAAHWLLLAALWLHIKNWHRPDLSPNPQFISWLLLTAISAAIHPYLTVMVLGLAVVFYLKFSLTHPRHCISLTVMPLFLIIMVVLFIWWQAGYFLLQQKNMELFGFGHYSMNLLAPFNGMGGGSALFRDFPHATTGQYEGFNYLGAGILMLGLLAGYELRKKFVQPNTLFYFLPLIIASLGFTLLALSNKITFGSLVLVEFTGDFWNIFNMFRGTGRFFWPAYYFIIFVILAVLIRRNSQAAALLFLTIGLIIQFIDLSPAYYMHRQVRDNPAFHWNPTQPIWENPLKSEFWNTHAANYKHINLLPPIACGEPPAPYQGFAYWAGRHGLTINTGHVARFDVEQTATYCQDLFNELRLGIVKADTIYVVHPDYLADFQNNAQHDISCSEIDGFMTCVLSDKLK